MFNKIGKNKIILALAIVLIASISLVGFVSTAGRHISSALWNVGGVRKIINEEKVLSAADVSHISITTQSVNLELIPDDSAKIRAHLLGELTSGRKSTLPQIKLTADALQNKVDICVTEQPSSGIISSYSGSVKLFVYIPKTYTEGMTVDSSSGNIRVGGFSTDNFTCTSSSGNLNIDSLTTREALLSTSSGNITLDGFSGSLTCRSSSGNSLIDYRKMDGTTEVNTVSGNIKVKLPGDSRFTLDASTVSGFIDCKPTLMDKIESEKSVKGTTGDNPNSNLIVLQTTSGSIDIY